ncbi:MAG: acyl-CoA/acyl-ACP dehydrogenase [Desulfobacterales bacterium]|nr:acyl-CoA/acyl-ACP dehydrogenase [Desulfobacterales bacterium]
MSAASRLSECTNDHDRSHHEFGCGGDLRGQSMDFNLSREQTDIQKAAQEFARGEFNPELVLEYDRKQEFPLPVWKKACELGFAGLHYPEEYGGQGLGILENALVAETFCRQDSGMGCAMALSDFGSEIILQNGTGNQKRILESLAAGKGLMTLAWMEEGYSPRTFSTTAKRRDGGFLIEGRKSYVPLAELSRFVLVLCQTGDEEEGQTALLLDGDIQGKDVSVRREKLGMRMVPMNDVSFSVQVPAENLIGGKREGGRALESFLNAIRIECGAMGVGIAQGALDRAIEYSKRREQFGRQIGAFEVIRNRLSDMFVSVVMARHILYHAALSMDQGKPEQRLILMTKRAACRAALDVANSALQIHGGYGYMTEGQIEHFYRDAKALDLFTEPGSRQRSLLAEEITSWRS